MIEITGLTDDAIQTINIKNNEGKLITLKFEYFENQLSWFLSLTYGDLNINKKRLVASVSFLKQFQRNINFDIFINTSDGQDPHYITDFISGRTTLYILTTDDLLLLDNLKNV